MDGRCILFPASLLTIANATAFVPIINIFLHTTFDAANNLSHDTSSFVA
jgi:hypothetical protein